jgi:hypothetical protein
MSAAAAEWHRRLSEVGDDLERAAEIAKQTKRDRITIGAAASFIGAVQALGRSPTQHQVMRARVRLAALKQALEEHRDD